MRIKTQFLINIISFSIILTIIGASVALTQGQITELNNKEALANDIQTGAADLNYISNNYFLYQDNSSISSWEIEFSSLSNKISALNSTDPQQQALVDSVSGDMESLNTVFAGVTSFLANAPRNVSIRILPNFQTQWNRMAVQTQALAFDAQRLSRVIKDQTNQTILLNTTLTIALLVSLAAFFIASYLVISRRTLSSITKLEKGIGVIGAGNLDYKIDAGKKDEVENISKSINLMASNLKSVTASKSDLEKEIAERKKVEESLRNRTEELETTQSKLEESAILVEEFANQMETLANQRAAQLKDAERLATIGATAGMVGHDIRNPLQAITGDVFLAKTDLASIPESDEKNSLQESLTEIEKNVDYINKIVADLQDFARPLKPNVEEIDIKLVIEDLLKKNGLPQNVEVTINVENDARKILVDSTFINRIMYNLVNNAVQAMPKGGKLIIRSYKDATDTLITVKDNGIGIPESVKTKLFTPMFTTKSKGQGFGLAVIKRMTEALGGTVTFESREGKGTTFTVRLPPPKELNGKWTYK